MTTNVELNKEVTELKSQVSELTSVAAEMMELLAEMRAAPAPPPPVASIPYEQTLVPESAIKAIKEIGEQASESKVFGPRPRFLGKDWVRVNPSSPKIPVMAAYFSEKGKAFDREAVVGQIVKLKAWSPERGHKYMVKFIGIGVDGCLESELEMVQPRDTR